MNIHKYTLIITALFSIIFTFCSTQITFAQDQHVKWFENREEALEAAKEQDKNILLLYGENTCGNCQAAKRFLNEDPSLIKLINESFVLWYCDKNTCAHGNDYNPGGSYKYPLLCVIDPYNPIPALTFTTGYNEASQIQTLLESKLPLFSGDKWHKDRTEAFNAARVQKKNVLLLYGRNACTNCQAAKGFISKHPINKITDENFILWFCNVDRKKEQASDYYNKALAEKGIVIFPLLCAIDPYDTIPALAYTTGYVQQYEIQDLLNGNPPTNNDGIYDTPTSAFIINNSLTISNKVIDEVINIYTINGQQIDSFEKTDNTVSRNTSSYPKGVLLISSSQGWSMKLVKQ